MAELKTQKTKASVTEFIAGIADDQQRKDSKALVKLMKGAAKSAPRMWGHSIVGFGEYHYKYDSGRENDWFMCGFAPRKGTLALYIMMGLEKHAAILKRLGKHKRGAGCLYIQKLADVDLDVLKELVVAGVKACEKSKKRQGA